ncbi:MAG: hypothetical protein J0H25_09350, partial [Rhizobiales bacterium]|nr:hypothetical protein [Hyphomicrobiales bacterium]
GLSPAITDQNAFSRLVSNMLASMNVAEQYGEDENEPDDSETPEDENQPRSDEQEDNDSQEDAGDDSAPADENETSDEQMDEGEMDGAEISDDDLVDDDGDDTEKPGEVRRPNQPFTDFNEKVDYGVFTQEFDETITAEELCDEAELDRLTADYEEADELPDEIDQRLGEIEAALDALDQRPVRYDPDEIAIAGVFISIDSDGSLCVDRGYVRPEDERPVEAAGDDAAEEEVDPETGEVRSPAVHRAVITICGEPVRTEEDEEDDGLKPLPERLIIELTAHRTLALRDALATNPQVALTMLLHKLASDTFRHTAPTGCLEASVRHLYLSGQSEEMKASPSAQSENDRHERWGDHVPADDQALWDWLEQLDDGTRLDLLAHCVSFGINALFERPNPHAASGISRHGLDVRLAQADRLAVATGLDMVAAGWKP